MVEDRQATIADLEGVMADGSEVHAVAWKPTGEFTGEIHPVADLFPMMTDDELNDLAADIKANGLVHPIVLDENGVLIDGRNRLMACMRAGMEPQFARMNGQDPVTFILSANIARRHMTKGQQAMAISTARKNRTIRFLVKDAAKAYGVSEDMLSWSNVVLRYAPELGPLVISGAKTLSDAYEEAREVKEEAEGDDAKMRRLKEDHSDLATMVQEERLTLAGAIAEANERDRQERQREEEERQSRIRLARQLDTVLNHLDPRSIPIDEYARQWLEVDPSLAGDHADFSAERARIAADVLLRYARLKETAIDGKAQD